MTDEPTELDPDTSHFQALLAALPQTDLRLADKAAWLEDKMHPRRTGFRRDGGRLVQHPGINSLPGDIVHLREFVIVTEVDGDTIWFEQIIGDPHLADPDYYIVANREMEDET